MTLSEVIQAVNSIGVLLTGAAALWAVAVGKRGVAVSTENKKALTTVQLKQDLNKTAIKDEIQAVRYDIQNGVGEKIATRAMEHMKPVLQEAAVIAADGLKIVAIEAAIVTTDAAAAAAGKLEATADKVAQALAEKVPWSGENRRTGPDDRRQT